MCICENLRILKDFILFKMLLIADFITCYYADIGEGEGESGYLKSDRSITAV